MTEIERYNLQRGKGSNYAIENEMDKYILNRKKLRERAAVKVENDRWLKELASQLTEEVTKQLNKALR